MNDQQRQPKGVPVGGQFATSARCEAAGAALLPPAVGGLGIAPGDSLYLSAHEAGTDIFDGVEIIHDDEGGYRAEGSVPINLVDAYREITGRDDSDPLDPGPSVRDEADTWLNDHQQILESFLRQRYDTELADGADDWAYQRAMFSAPLDPATDTVQTVAARLEDETKAIQLYNETDRGTFGCPYVWSEARTHLEAWNSEVEHAQRAFLADTLEDSGAPYGDAQSRADGMPVDDLEQGAGAVRVFMRDNHDLITQAKQTHREQHGTEYLPSTLGRDISLAIHNPPGTPHGRMAFGALPARLQRRLQERARVNAAA